MSAARESLGNSFPSSSAASRSKARVLASVAIWGVVLVAAENMPLFQVTTAGNLLRVIWMVVGIVMVATFLPRITAVLNGVEVLAIGGFFFLVMFEGVHAFLIAQVTSPYDVVRMTLLPIVCYLAAKVLDNEVLLERYFHLFYIVCLISAVQSIASFVVTIAGYRALGLVTIHSGQQYYQYSWFGLLGGYSSNIRTNWYFSEPSHYAQMLLPGMFYGLSRGRVWGVITIAVGLLTTVAIASLAPALVLLLAYTIRKKNFLPLLVIVAACAVLLVPTVGDWALGALNLSARIHSVRVHSADYSIAMRVLTDSPLGLGLVDIQNLSILLRPSSGLARLIILFGVLIFPHVLLIFSYLGLNGIGITKLTRSSAICLGLLGTAVATVSAGPWFKYWMIFMLSALVTTLRIERAKQQTIDLAR